MLWLLPSIPATAAALLWMVRSHRRGTLALVSALSLAATLALVALAASAGWTGGLRWSEALTLQVALTPLSALVAALVPAVALPVLVYAAYREHEIGLVRLLSLLLFFCGAMELLVIADDLLTLLIGWEIVGACSWALIAHEWRDAANPNSARYAFVVTRFGDLGLFLAAMSAYAGSGSFAYSDLARLDAPHLAIVASGVVLSAASKSGQIPFSPWLFRAMAGPASVSALLHAATMVAAGAYLLARLQPVLAPVSGFGVAVMTIGTVTALAGGAVALLQPDVKKVLAASTSAHFGLMFVAVGAGFPGVAVLHLVAHGFFKSLLFMAAGIAIDRSGSHALSAMRLGRSLPVVAVLAAVGAAALAGVPPLGAAWTKDAIAAAAAAAGSWWSAAVVVAGGLSAAYAVRWIWLAYGPGDLAAASEEESSNEKSTPFSSPAVTASLGWLAVASVLLSALWLPRVRESLATAISIVLPHESAWLTGAAIGAIAVGALAGRWIAVRMPTLGHGAVVAPVADWWRLPALIEAVVTTPTGMLARATAKFDDSLVDRGVALTTAFVSWLSRATSHIGELVADGLALGPARLVSMGGQDARRLQTGFSHQAFAVLLLGALALGTLLFATRL